MRSDGSYDVVVVGSGFGGSVTALRLAEKGYRVVVLEAGRRWRGEDFPRTNWSLRRYLWLPRLGCRGIQRLTLLDDVLVLSGVGVGGGSLVYANTLYEPLAPFWRDPQWAGIADWRRELAPCYERVRRMLGAARVPEDTPADEVVREVAGPNINESIVLKEIIDLTSATSAYAQFWARWEIEDEYDYVLFQASTDGENWENLCGERSKLGGVFQPYEEPLYDGKQTQWVLETSDLSSYTGDQIQLRFLISTDGYVHKDGFYFDDFKVIAISEETVSSADITSNVISVFPNPATDRFMIRQDRAEAFTISVYNSLGVKVFSQHTDDMGNGEVRTNNWPEGMYHYVLHNENRNLTSGNICIQR